MRSSFLLIMAVLFATASVAGDASKKSSGNRNVAKELEAKLEAKVVGLRPSPIPGLLQGRVNGVLRYFSADGKYELDGSIVDVQSGRNLTTLAVLKGIPDSTTVVYSPKEPKYSVTVFTDTTCGYCRKFHEDVNELNANGVKVRYLLYPRAGPGSESAQTLENIWCADNPQQAMTDAKANRPIANKNCPHPIEKHIEYGHAFKLRGTPMIITGGGEIIPGYRPAPGLIQTLRNEGEGNI